MHGNAPPIAPRSTNGTRDRIMTRRRVFYVLDSLEANDVSLNVVTLLGRLARSRFDPRVVSLGGDDELWPTLREMKVSVYRLGLTGSLGMVRAVPRLRRVFRGLAPDLVHACEPWAAAAARLAVPDGVPFVRTFGRRSTIEGRVRSRLMSVMERRALRRGASRTLVAHEGLRPAAAARDPATDIEVVPDCIDVPAVRERVAAHPRAQARVRLGILPDEVAFACIRPFEVRARVEDILDGFATACLERPDLRLLLLGSGPEEHFARWRAEDLRLGDAVVFLGVGADPHRVWSACDGVVDGSGSAAWSRTLLEVVAAGLPVLRWTEPAAASSGDAALTGLPAGQPDRFAVELLRLAGDEAHRRRVRTAIADLAARIDVARVAEQLEALYTSLIETEAPGRPRGHASLH